MIEDRKKIEFWDYLTTEKNQARPKGITVQRLAVIKPLAIASDLWLTVIEDCGAATLTAHEFYRAATAVSANSRTLFWQAIRSIILKTEETRKTTAKETPSTNASRRNVGRGAPARRPSAQQTSRPGKRRKRF